MIKTKTFYKFFDTALFFLLVVVAFALALNKNFTLAVNNGLKLWVSCVLPALFPYFFITAILSSLSLTSKLSKKLSPLTKRLFRCGGVSGYLFFISLISGYPTGSKGVADAYSNGLLSKTEAERASAFCSTSSPAFMISSVGSLTFNSPRFGLLLFLCHFITAIIIGIIFSFYKRKDKPSNDLGVSLSASDNLLYDSVYSSVISILVVGGLIVIFSVFSEILFSFIKVNGVIKAIFSGLLECTGGLKLLASTNFYLAFPIACLFCGFGGASIICQSLAFLKKAKIKTAPFLLSKVLSAVINFFIGLLFFFIFF